MGFICGEFINESYIEENKFIIKDSLDKDRDIIIFDFGSVLIDGDFDKALLQDPRIPNEYIEDLKKIWFINDSKFTETCSKEQYIQEVIKRAPDHLKYLVLTVAEISISCLNVMPHTYSLLNELRKEGYSLYYLSNWDRWSSRELIRNGKMDFLKLFDGGIFSCDVGCMKPDEKIYKCLFNKYNIDPNRAIFFDDRKENIDAANKLGIKGILFNKDTGDEILKDFILNESYIEESKAIDHCKYKKCPKCGSDKIGIFIHGEPIYKCKECGEYLGVVPFKEATIIFTSGHFDKYKDCGEKSLREKAMTSKERNKLDDDDFGIPELRKYPLHDKNHVEQAIKMFNHVENKYEAELADNLLDAMKKYHISTDVVGENNRLKKYIKEDTITEGVVFNDKTPADIKKLGEDINDIISNINDDDNDISDMIKDTLKNRDFSSDEKKLIYDVCKKVRVNIVGYTKKNSNVKGVEVSNTHSIIATFKDYILTLKFIGVKGTIRLLPLGITINYDSNSDIPKNVAFDAISILSPNVDKVKSTKHSLKISALSNSIDSGYPRISHKYSSKYKVKKNFGGLSITLSTLKDIKESSPVTGAMHRQDYQPDAVYIVNYLKKNTFVRDLAICRDKMSSIFVCDNGEPIHMSLTDFKEMAEDIKVYKCLYETSFGHILGTSKSGLDFYKNMVEDHNITDIIQIESDYRFTRVPSYIDELNSIEECIINSAPKSGIVHEVYCPIIPLIDLNTPESVVHYFRDINGVFAQNIDTLSRSASYNKVEDIPKTTINLLQSI